MGMKKVKFNRKKRKFKEFIKILIAKIKDNDVTGFAAQLSYFFLLSLFPMLIFLFTLLPYTPLTQQDIFNVIKDFAPPETYQMIKTTLAGILDNRSGGLLSLGIIATLWTASKGMNALIKSLNRAYEVEEARSFIMTRGLSVLLTLGLIFVFIIALLLPVFGKQIATFLLSYVGLSDNFLNIWGAIRWLLTPVILFVVFLIIYYLAPNIKIRDIKAVPGAVFASIGWIVVSLAFSFYVSNFSNYSAMYGGIGAIIVLMLWLYFSAIIVMVGGEINSYFTEKNMDHT